MTEILALPDDADGKHCIAFTSRAPARVPR